MPSTRAMLERVRRLEQARTAPRSPLERWYGSLAAFEQDAREQVDAGSLDRVDWLGENGDGGIMRAIRAWHEQDVFAMWQRDRIWECAR